MRLERTQIVTLANQKGGCGKTTASVSLAAALVQEGLSVCLVDADPQCNATDSYGIDRDQLGQEGRYTLADAYLSKLAARQIEHEFDPERFDGRLTIVPGHRALGTVPHRLEAQLQATIANDQYSDLDADDIKNEHRQRLKVSLDSLRGKRDVVIIDTPPDLGFLMTTALIASDWYVIPVFPSGYDLKGLETLLRTVEKVRERYNPDLKLLGVLLGNYSARVRLDEDIQKMLSQKFGKDLVFSTVIHRSVKHREASIYGKTIFEHAGDQQAAEQFLSLAREAMTRLEKNGQAEQASQPEVVLKEANRG
jgi:chromosome partitioning protein